MSDGHNYHFGPPAGGWDAWKDRATRKAAEDAKLIDAPSFVARWGVTEDQFLRREHPSPACNEEAPCVDWGPPERVYVAGPMRGLPERNYPAFHTAAAKLRALGYAVVSPAEMDVMFDNVAAGDGVVGVWEEEDRRAIRRDIEAILSSDYVYVLPGWARSEGAKLEIRIALAAGIPLMWEDEPVGDWTPLEPLEIEDEFVRLLSFSTGDGAGKRRAGVKVSWRVDGGHEAALYRHLFAWEEGEKADRDSGAHPLVHVAWRALAIAWQESRDS